MTAFYVVIGITVAFSILTIISLVRGAGKNRQDWREIEPGGSKNDWREVEPGDKQGNDWRRLEP